MLFAFVVAGCRLGVEAGPIHTFIIDPAPPFLTEKLAIEKGWETLAQDGCKTNMFDLVELPKTQRESHFDDSTWAKELLARKAPDGTLDKYFKRASATKGMVNFYNPKKRIFRQYEVNLEGNNVICRTPASF